MCTSLTLLSKCFYAGRNLDLEYHFGEQVVITPRQYCIEFKRQLPLKQHFAMVGMANVTQGYPLYAEAMNEYGLYMAGLNFPGNAVYWPPCDNEEKQVAPYELIPWVLGQCKTLEQAKKILNGIRIIDIPFCEQMPSAPLHWHLADRTGALVMESTQNGVKLYEDKIGVLTNNPPYEFHCTNLSQYLGITAKPAENRFSQSVELSPFGQGMGGIGLPGDASPASRFVRAAFLKHNSVFEDDEDAVVAQFFHILDAVAMVRGSVITPEGKNDITTYSCCINGQQGIYYYKTYENNRISAIHLHQENLDASELCLFPLISEQSIFHQN